MLAFFNLLFYDLYVLLDVAKTPVIYKYKTKKEMICMFKFKKCSNYQNMSERIFKDFRNYVKIALENKDIISIAIATGKTLELFLDILENSDMDVDKIDLYIVDEYVGYSYTDKRSCTYDLMVFLSQKFYKFHSVKVFSIDNYEEDMNEYNNALKENGLDICILGVGTDGHIGFCYPIEYNDIFEYYKIKSLTSKQKHLHFSNGWFSSESEVPNQVITLSVWGILQSSVIMIGVVKKEKVYVLQNMNAIVKANCKDCPVLYLNDNNNTTVYIG